MEDERKLHVFDRLGDANNVDRRVFDRLIVCLKADHPLEYGQDIELTSQYNTSASS